MEPPPWAPPPRAGVELRVRAVDGLHPASRAAVSVTVVSPAGDRYCTSDSPVVNGRARLEAWARLALPREAGAQRALTFEVCGVCVANWAGKTPTRPCCAWWAGRGGQLRLS